jgi:predicted amidohydrolase
MHFAELEREEGFELVELAGKRGSHLIVTIEGFNESVSPRDSRYDFIDFAEPLDGPIVGRFSALAKKHHSYIVAGLYTRRNGKAFNSGVLFGPDGDIAGIYDKVHMPYDDDKYFTPGDRYPVFETEHGIIGVLVCWDMQYPEAVREIALGGADLIACPTQGWEPIYGYCRAYENSVSLAVAMYVPFARDLWEDCDPSCIVDNMGKVVAAAPRDGSQVVTAELDIRKEPDPQYGADEYTGMRSMRQIRMAQRRPDTYRLITRQSPPILSRYGKSGTSAGDNESTG